MESFAKKENLLKKIWAQEGGCSHPSPPLRPPMVIYNIYSIYNHINIINLYLNYDY